MKPTSWRTLVPAAAVAAVLGWFFARLLENRRGEVGVPPWSAAIVLAVVGVALTYTAWRTRARLARKPGTTPLHPLVAARLAALGLAGSRAGALVAGAYLGYSTYVAGDLSTNFRERVFWRGATCAAAAALLVVGALLLERALRLPELDDSDDDADDADGRDHDQKSHPRR
jgi:Protein of unknown function (DUF3180)